MIIIQSEDYDLSTNDIVEWLNSFGVKYKRINVEERSTKLIFIEFSSSGECEIILEIHGEKVNIKDVISYWHRRGQFLLDRIELNGYLNLKEIFDDETIGYIKHNLYYERETLNTYIEERLNQVPFVIRKPDAKVLNKLSVLKKASSAGLTISSTLVTTKKELLADFLGQKKSIITKAILDNLNSRAENENMFFYTEVVEPEYLDKIPETFYYSLFQEKIEKSYELRIFYLLGKFYSMAIFSQNDQQTSVDFRKYNDKRPNRRVPYEIPDELKIKLTILMKSLQLDTGSIDMIVTNELEYVFLEVNPVGQFGMVSKPCNYPVEREIAEFLSTGKLPK